MENENDEKKNFNKLVDLGLIFAVQKCTKENCSKKAQNMNLTTRKRYKDSKNCLLTWRWKDLKRPQIWSFGLAERKNLAKNENGKGYFEVVPNREAQTLLEIIYDKVLDETTIMSDCWSSYEKISKLKDYTHLTVNHTYNFLDPNTGACTNPKYFRPGYNLSDFENLYKTRNDIKHDVEEFVQLDEPEENDINCYDVEEADIESIFGSLKGSEYGSEFGDDNNEEESNDVEVEIFSVDSVEELNRLKNYESDDESYPHSETITIKESDFFEVSEAICRLNLNPTKKKLEKLSKIASEAPIAIGHIICDQLVT
ncbi:hypothetical protein BpHYR1_025304 [Brachionus plicatilis]|uniref:ISXO2-like transposase domain-containing protein n=1 Tax=Brachionus plicatilis TaxID=10195 RepID=A0A3M7QGV6_BRAPC|nr:hypothetical protein BpHYR1_025304 [Brachionus plicatilis]